MLGTVEAILYRDGSIGTRELDSACRQIAGGRLLGRDCISHVRHDAYVA